MPHTIHRSSTTSAMLAGVVTAIVGFTSSFAVVLTGLRQLGATADQASSGLLVLCLTMGAGSVWFSWRYRMPITLAWSTPGAALMAGAAAPAGGFASAVGAFVVAGVLIALCGLVKPLGRAVARIPTALANAMLAGVLLVLCVEPVKAAMVSPAAILPVIAVWLVCMRFARRWAVPAALAAAVAVILASGSLGHLGAAPLSPVVRVVTPQFDLSTVIALAVPLFLVTMTSQNIPGMAVLSSFGYRPPLAPPLLYTGAATAVGAFGGAHAINLAAISAALAAGPQAGSDPGRRWIAGVSTGVFYLLFGPIAAAVTTVSDAAPQGLMAAIAGLALIGTFAASAGAALADGQHREAAAITFLVAASGLTIAGIGAAFWGLVAGAGYLLLMRQWRTTTTG